MPSTARWTNETVDLLFGRFICDIIKPSKGVGRMENYRRSFFKRDQNRNLLCWNVGSYSCYRCDVRHIYWSYYHFINFQPFQFWKDFGSSEWRYSIFGKPRDSNKEYRWDRLSSTSCVKEKNCFFLCYLCCEIKRERDWSLWHNSFSNVRFEGNPKTQ